MMSLRLIPELKILVAGEVHDHESTASPPCPAPVLSQNGHEGPNGPSRADVKIRQSLQVGGACVRRNPIELGNLRVFWSVSDDDAASVILPGKLESVDGESC